VAIEAAGSHLVALPDDLDFTSAAALGCRFATAYRAVITQGRVQAGEWVAVHGCGGVGISAVMIAVVAGARVVAVDVSPQALALAAELGAAPVQGDLNVIANELEILGSHGMAAHEYPAMLARIVAGDIDPRALVGRTISLAEAPVALTTMDSHANPGMTVIELP
jgi:alcohol dehydrogenase